MDDQLHLLTGVYALNALDGDERSRLEGLPFGHPTAQEARELSETAAFLAAGTTPVPPPPALKERLMAQIAHTPQAEVAPGPVPAPRPFRPAPSPLPGAPVPPPATEPPVPARGRPGQRRRNRFPASSRWLAAAAAVLLVAAGGAGLWGFQQQQQRDQADRALAAAQGSRSAVLDRILAAPDARVQAVPAPGGATMLIAQSKDARLAGVVTIGMAAPPAGKAYQLWLIDAAGSAEPAGLVRAGDGSTWNELPGGLANAAYLGMTVEPAGGSAHPTTKPIILQSLA